MPALRLVLSALTVALVLRVILLAGDPAYSTLKSSAATPLWIYPLLRGVLDQFYSLTTWILTPISLLFSIVKGFFPIVQSKWFPVTQSWVIGRSVLAQIGTLNWGFIPPNLLKELLPSVFMGVIDWLALVAIPVYSVVLSVFAFVWAKIKNILWTAIIEMTFSQRKKQAYEAEIEKRTRDLTQLNTDYRYLSEEASKLKTSTLTDELTQLYNKRFFIQTIFSVCQSAVHNLEQLGIIMVDIDHFKKLNDNYGHMFGDEVLTKVASIVKQCTPQGAYACRFGGEEISIIVPRMGFMAVQGIAEEIAEGLAGMSFPEHPEVVVTVSQGICVTDFTLPGTQAITPEVLIKKADALLYEAKTTGRNRICADMYPDCSIESLEIAALPAEEPTMNTQSNTQSNTHDNDAH